MVQDGTLFKSKIFRSLFALCIAIVVVGALMKILHWPYANELLLAGFLSTILFYSVRSLLKRPKRWLDLLKWGWVVSICIVSPFRIFHWPTTEALVQLPNVLFLGLLLIYLRKIMLERAQLSE
jgi:gliding motility-associated GldL-like protein